MLTQEFGIAVNPIKERRHPACRGANHRGAPDRAALHLLVPALHIIEMATVEGGTPSVRHTRFCP